MKFRTALLAASVLAVPAIAMAQPVTGPYVSVNVGPSYLEEQDIGTPTTAFGATSAGGGKVKTNIGFATGASVGWGFGNGLRVELQGDWKTNKIYRFGVQTGGNNIEQYDGFVNALYDFNLAPLGVTFMSPYVGVGVGYGEEHFQGLNSPGFDSLGSTLLRTTSEDGGLAAQGIVGLSFPMPVPGLSLTAEYRITAITEDMHFDGQYLTAAYSTRVRFKADNALNHAGMFGLRYALFQPAPPPPPPPPAPVAAPAPEPARTYLVFFDWDRADLTPRARQIVAQAAQASTHVQTTRIEVNGYTDLSGTAAYNLRLSVRRARSVEAELIRDGVPRGEITIHGYGESNPLVPTAQGVREPQNRRVEIILH